MDPILRLTGYLNSYVVLLALIVEALQGGLGNAHPPPVPGKGSDGSSDVLRPQCFVRQEILQRPVNQLHLLLQTVQCLYLSYL